jgi:hypothetical protein
MSYPAGSLPYSGVGEAVAGVGGSLWDWTVRAWNAMGGVIDDIYPPDDPNKAKALGDAWIKAAEELETAISASSGAGDRIRDTWPDANGFDVYALVREVNKGQYGSGGDGYEELAAGMRKMGEFCHQYAEQVARAQNQIKSELIHAALDFALTFAIPGGPWLFASRMALRLARLVKIAGSAARLGNWAGKAGKIVMIPIREAADEVVTNSIEQGLNISQGYQDGFNGKESFTNAVAGAIGAPVSAVAGTPGALLGKGIRKTDVGKNVLDNAVGKHVSTAVSAAGTNAISSPISSYAAENMVNGHWGALDDLSGYQKSIKDNWLTSGAIGAGRANAHLAGAQGHNAFFGENSPTVPEEVVTTGNPPGGPPPSQAMAPEAAAVDAGQGSVGASTGEASSGAATGSGRGPDAFGGSESHGTTASAGDASGTGRGAGSASSGASSAATTDPGSSRSGASSAVHGTDTSTPASSAQSASGQSASGQGTSAQAASPTAASQVVTQSGPAQTVPAQNAPVQSSHGQSGPVHSSPTQPGPPGSPTRTPQAKPAEGEPNRSDPGTNSDQDGVSAPVEAPAEPAPDVPVLPAEVPDEQSAPEPEGKPEDPEVPAEPAPALPALPGPAVAQAAPRASNPPDEAGTEGKPARKGPVLEAAAAVPGETHAGQEDPEAIRRAMEAENATALSVRSRLLMGILIAVRLLGLPNTIDSALELKPPKSGPVELIRKRVGEEGDPGDADKPRPPDDPDNPPWRGHARIDPDTGEITFGDSPGPATMGTSQHDAVGGSRWIDARRTVAPGPWDGAVITGEGVLYAPAGMSIGDDLTTRNAHLRVMIANRPDRTRAYVVTLHGSGNGHPIPGLSLTLDSRLTDEQMRAIEEIFMLSPEQVAEATLASPYYTPGQPVQLNSCHSGSSGWAQRYADAVGAEVTAPLARLDVMPDGTLRVHGFPDGKGWTRFTPGGTAPVEVPAPGNRPTADVPAVEGTPSAMDAVINPGRDETAEFLGREEVQDALRRGNEISERDPDSRIKVDGVPLHIGDAIAKLLPRHPEFVKTLLATPFLLDSLLARPQTLGNVLQYPEAIAMVIESVAELEARGADEILDEHKETPRPGPIEPTEFQRQVVEDVRGGILDADLDEPPGQPGYEPPIDSTPEQLSAYNKEFLLALYESWRTDQDELNALAVWLAAETGGDAGFRTKVKSWVRALDKVAKYQEVAAKLTDLAGVLVRFDTVAEVYQALEVLRVHLASGGSPIRIVDIEDRFTAPQKSGYRDIVLSVCLANGHIAEFRLHLKSMDEVARFEHSLYELRRDLPAVSTEQGRALSREERALEALILSRERELFWEATRGGLPADDDDSHDDDEGGRADHE